MRQGPFVKFDECPEAKRPKLTKTWMVCTLSVEASECLGFVKWWAHWRRYCFFPYEDMLFDANCLWDIADFCARMTKEQQEAAKLRKK